MGLLFLRFQGIYFAGKTVLPKHSRLQNIYGVVQTDELWNMLYLYMRLKKD